MSDDRSPTCLLCCVGADNPRSEAMKTCAYHLNLHQPAGYQIKVVGHLDIKKTTWFETMSIANQFGEDGTPITVLTGEVLDQAMLHGLLNRIRDLGLPLVSVNLVEADEASASLGTS